MRWSTTVWPCSIRNSPPQSHRAAQRQSLQRQRNLGAAYNFRDDLNDRRRGCEEDVAAEQRQRERRRGDRIEIFIDLSNIFFAPDPLL